MGVYIPPIDHAFGLSSRGRVDLLKFSHGYEWDDAAVRFEPGDPSIWRVGNDALRPNSNGILLGSPVRYLDQAAPLVVADYPMLNPGNGLSPATMLARIIETAVRLFLRANSTDRRVDSIVMTAPLDYFEFWADHIRQACEIAGVKLAGIVNDPTAILTFYGWHQQADRDKPEWRNGEGILVETGASRHFG